jgi:hypothetical protein
MKAAITTLEVALHALENNEAIQRADGRTALADASLVKAQEIRDAIAVLKDRIGNPKRWTPTEPAAEAQGGDGSGGEPPEDEK